jgi:tetratricopeptide (TPR) repeat protein
MTLCQGPLLVCLALALPPAAEPETEKSPALLLWEQGQEAMLAGRTEEAIALYQKSLKLDSTLAQNYLSLAAGYLEKGDDETAAEHLDRYLELQPEHLVARAHYAELLIRLKRFPDARVQLERFISDIQDEEELAEKHLISCHSKLMTIAMAEEDSYAEHLNRGIGLFWLACQRASLPEDASDLDVESVLCQAAAELTLARRNRPDEARPNWYLYEVWARLAQSQPAQRSLHAAQSAAPFTYLTPTEQRGLSLAVRQAAGDRLQR